MSINRFERKKNVELALKAFVETKERVAKDIFDTYRLVLAGGYDHRVIENVDYLKELDQLATSYGLETFTIRPGSLEKPPATAKVVFLCSFNDRQRTYLLDNSQVMLYTPSFEHFGITPVEGMYACLPVIAANNGGPLETIKDKETGLLLDPTPEAWAAGLADMMLSKYDLNEMGKQGRDHVKAKFSLEAFAVELEGLLELTVSGGQPTHHRYDNVEYAMRVVVAVVAVVAWYKYLF